MKVLLNSFNPNFQAIHLNKDEKQQINASIQELQHKELSEFQRNILKSDIMDVFIPHIKEEAAQSDNPKATSVDLNMKMFDALNSFTDKKDPLGWFLSVLNGTKYEEPKPTIFDMPEEETAQILEQIAERKRQLNRSVSTFNFVNKDTYRPSKTSKAYFDFAMEDITTYSPQEIQFRAVDLRKYFGQQYRIKDMINIVNTNKCLVSYDNKYFDKYVTDFAEIMGVDKNIIKSCIAEHPVIIRRDITDIRDRAKTLAQLTGSREDYCKYSLLRKPKLIDTNPYAIKERADALRFYKALRNKQDLRPNDIFTAPSVNVSFFKALTFLVACHDKKNINVNNPTNEELLEYLKSQNDDKVYKFILPENEMTDKFINYANEFEENNFDRDIFEFEVINAKEYAHIDQPKSFTHFEK